MVAWQIYKRSINTEKFLQYLEHLTSSHNGKNPSILLDNMRVHRPKKVTEFIHSRNIDFIFNVPYSP